MSLEMLDFNSSLSCQELQCLVDSQLVSHQCLSLLLVWISCQEVMVSVLDDPWNYVSIMLLKTLHHGPSLMRFQTRSLQILLKSSRLLNSSLIRSAVRVRTLLISQSFWRFTRIPAQILHWSIFLELQEFPWLDQISPITLSKLQEQCVWDMFPTPELLFYVPCLLMLIWQLRMVFKWLEKWTPRVLEQLV